MTRLRVLVCGGREYGLGWCWRPRYLLSQMLIHIGLMVMPESRYKRELLTELWALRGRVMAAVAAAKEPNNAV